ncbi:MAG: ATP-binding protein [Coriobacteriia bacterium]|nr:ATP-binding protein [Coriobacteriia bacterium]
MIKRPHYLNWLHRWKNKDVIKVITGMRRSGKSTIMQLFQEDLMQSGVPSQNIISINFESLEESYPLTAQELYNYVVARLAPDGVTYVFLDEIQQVKEFEKAASGLFVRDDIDLYLTGSNAHFLSSEIATLLTGRYVEIQVYPLSFKEYYSAIMNLHDRVKYSEDNPLPSSFTFPTKEEVFNTYLTQGGLPYTAMLNDSLSSVEYLEGVLNTILVKDIAARRPRLDMNTFRAVASFLADNIGNVSSVRNITNALAQQGTKVSQGTVSEYIGALLETYLLFKVDRYDLKGKAYLQTKEKYYVGDLGFRFWLLGKSAGDIGRRIENVVYLELRRRYRRVDIGKQGQKEIDFVASKDEETHYYQVAQTVLAESTLERELDPLLTLSDNHPKTLLTLDVVGTGDIHGIRHKNLIEWLME